MAAPRGKRRLRHFLPSHACCGVMRTSGCHQRHTTTQPTQIFQRRAGRELLHCAIPHSTGLAPVTSLGIQDRSPSPAASSGLVTAALPASQLRTPAQWNVAGGCPPAPACRLKPAGRANCCNLPYQPVPALSGRSKIQSAVPNAGDCRPPCSHSPRFSKAEPNPQLCNTTLRTPAAAGPPVDPLPIAIVWPSPALRLLTSHPYLSTRHTPAAASRKSLGRIPRPYFFSLLSSRGISTSL